MWGHKLLSDGWAWDWGWRALAHGAASPSLASPSLRPHCRHRCCCSHFDLEIPQWGMRSMWFSTTFKGFPFLSALQVKGTTAVMLSALPLGPGVSFWYQQALSQVSLGTAACPEELQAHSWQLKPHLEKHMAWEQFLILRHQLMPQLVLGTFCTSAIPQLWLSCSCFAPWPHNSPW